MYLATVYNDGSGTVIHEPGDSSVKVDSAQISREKSTFSSFSFEIFPDNPGWDALTPFATTVEVVNTRTGRIDFDGRVIQIVPSMDDDGTISRSVTCEDVMGYLCDSLQLYAEEQHYADAGGKSGLQIYIDALLMRHNAVMPDAKKIYAGNITLQTFDTSGGVTKSISRGSTWDNIKDKLLDVFGGEMRVRRGSDGKLYLDYAEALGQTRATKIELARNMASAESEMDPDQVITRLYPYGAKITITEEDPDTGEEVEVETENRIGIELANNGLPYIDDVVAIEQYGIIEGYQEWDDVTQPTNLLSKAQAWLGENNAVPMTFTLTAFDLSLLGLDVDDFEIYDSYPCYNPLIGLDEVLEIVKQVIDINEPENSTFDMGETAFRLSADLGDTATKGDIQYIQSQIQTNITNVNNRVIMNQAYIAVMEDKITQNVSQTIETTVGTAVGKIDFGGRNLILGSQDYTGGIGNLTYDYVDRYIRASNTITDDYKDGCSAAYCDAQWQGAFVTFSALKNILSVGDTLQLSFNVANGSDDSVSISVVFLQYDSSGERTYELTNDHIDLDTVESGQDVRLKCSLEVVQEMYDIYSSGGYFLIAIQAASAFTGGDLRIYQVKLEKGSVYTDWTPAPEDMREYTDDSVGGVYDAVNDVSNTLDVVQGGLNSANGALENLNQIVTTTVTKVTNLDQTAQGWDFQFQTIKESVTYLDNTMQTNFSETLKYIRFIDGEIWLGRDPEPGEDDFKVRISNERVSFLQNNIEVAYISNKMLYITDARITNRLEIGGFAFFPRSNGSLTLRVIDDYNSQEPDPGPEPEPVSDQLTYQANASDATGTTPPTTGYQGQNVVVSGSGFTRPGYDFAIWNTKADGQGTSYSPGDNYMLTTADDILYAQWTAQAPAEPNRNLALATGSPLVYPSSGSSYFYNPTYGYIPYLSEYGISLVQAGGTFTVSYDYSITGVDTSFMMETCLHGAQWSYTRFGEDTGNVYVPVGSSSGHVEITAQPNAGQMQWGDSFLFNGMAEGTNLNAKLTITNFKFEQGDTATDWTAAPED